MKKAIVAWSGGKDSCLAYHLAKAQGIEIVGLLTMLDGEHDCSRSNGVAREILESQAQSLGLPILYLNTSWDDYRQNLLSGLKVLIEKYQIDSCIFGDMDNSIHKKFNDELCHEAKIKAIMPIWGKSRFEVYTLLHKYQIKAKINVINNSFNLDDILGADYHSLNLYELVSRPLDICGEQGEFHTLVYDCKEFNRPIKITESNIHKLDSVTIVNYRLD
jgi:uncharacterized protein (TIGR00290 family)